MPFDGTAINPTAKTLIDARGYLARGWCKYSEGRTSSGNLVRGNHPNAVAWCILGAVEKALDGVNLVDPTFVNAITAIDDALPAEYRGSICTFNNTQTSVEPVLAVMDKAIERALTHA